MIVIEPPQPLVEVVPPVMIKFPPSEVPTLPEAPCISVLGSTKTLSFRMRPVPPHSLQRVALVNRMIRPVPWHSGQLCMDHVTEGTQHLSLRHIDHEFHDLGTTLREISSHTLLCKVLENLGFRLTQYFGKVFARGLEP